MEIAVFFHYAGLTLTSKANYYRMEVVNSSVQSGDSTNRTNAQELRDVWILSLVPDWSKTVVAIYVIIAMVIGMPGNSLVFFILLKVKRKTSTDWFVIFITLCDFVSLLFNGTVLELTGQIGKKTHTEYICRCIVYVTHFVILQSSLLITCVGVDRYMKTCKPHSVFFTPKSALTCSLIITAASALYSIFTLFTTKVNINGDCSFDSSKATLRSALYLVLFFYSSHLFRSALCPVQQNSNKVKEQNASWLNDNNASRN